MHIKCTKPIERNYVKSKLKYSHENDQLDWYYTQHTLPNHISIQWFENSNEMNVSSRGSIIHLCILLKRANPNEFESFYYFDSDGTISMASGFFWLCHTISIAMLLSSAIHNT